MTNYIRSYEVTVQRRVNSQGWISKLCSRKLLHMPRKDLGLTSSWMEDKLRDGHRCDVVPCLKGLTMLKWVSDPECGTKKTFCMNEQDSDWFLSSLAQNPVHILADETAYVTRMSGPFSLPAHQILTLCHVRSRPDAQRFNAPATWRRPCQVQTIWTDDKGPWQNVDMWRDGQENGLNHLQLTSWHKVIFLNW